MTAVSLDALFFAVLVTDTYVDALPFIVLARASERRVTDFSPHELANTVWALGTEAYADALLFAVLARVTERRVDARSP